CATTPSFLKISPLNTNCGYTVSTDLASVIPTQLSQRQVFLCDIKLFVDVLRQLTKIKNNKQIDIPLDFPNHHCYIVTVDSTFYQAWTPLSMAEIVEEMANGFNIQRFS